MLATGALGVGREEGTVCLDRVAHGFRPHAASRLRGQHRNAPCRCGPEVQHLRQLRLHPLRALAISLVDDEDVGDLEEPRLHHLHGVAGLGHQDHDDRVREPHDVKLGLPDAHRLDEHVVDAERIEEADHVARGAGEAAVAAAGREAADEDARVEEVRLHADAVAEHGAAAERAGSAR